MRFIYVMDPMCAWCFAFQPELETFLSRFPGAQIDWVMGGLAPDSTIPMDAELQKTIAGYWQQIETRTQVRFNHDYWQLNTPYRSTYPACRAVISAEMIKPNSSQAMVKAIQTAYYCDAKNPSLVETLIECADTVGVNIEKFKFALSSEETAMHFQQQLMLSQKLQVSGFPALFYIDNANRACALTLGYTCFNTLLQRLCEIDNNALSQ